MGDFYAEQLDAEETVVSWRRTTCEQALYYRDHMAEFARYAGEYILLQDREVRWHGPSADWHAPAVRSPGMTGQRVVPEVRPECEGGVTALRGTLKRLAEQGCSGAPRRKDPPWHKVASWPRPNDEHSPDERPGGAGPRPPCRTPHAKRWPPRGCASQTYTATTHCCPARATL